jgi:hypothetical protein
VSLVGPHGQRRQGSGAKLKTQRGIKIDHEVIPGANHFFEDKTAELQVSVGKYLDMRLAKALKDEENKEEREKEREREREKERQREREEVVEAVEEVDDDE